MDSTAAADGDVHAVGDDMLGGVATAMRPDEHWRSILWPRRSCGARPEGGLASDVEALAARWRAAPTTTSSISAPSTPDGRRASRMAWPRAWPGLLKGPGRPCRSGCGRSDDHGFSHARQRTGGPPDRRTEMTRVVVESADGGPARRGAIMGHGLGDLRPPAWTEVHGFSFTDIHVPPCRRPRNGARGLARRGCARFRPHTVDELSHALDHARQSADVGCVLLPGNGPSSKTGRVGLLLRRDHRVRCKDCYR